MEVFFTDQYVHLMGLHRLRISIVMSCYNNWTYCICVYIYKNKCICRFFHMLLEGQIFRTPELLWKAKVSESFEGAWSENLLMPDT